jgi:hypothetical protein
MKKILLSIAVVAAAMTLNAQGVWKATGTEPKYSASTEMGFGIASLTVMHSDISATGVIGKTDAWTATSVPTPAPAGITYNGITYDNKAIIQGANNCMYYAFLPTKNGILDIATKASANKMTYVMLATGATSLADLTTTFSADGNAGNGNALVKANGATYPSVTSSLTGLSATYDGTTAINTTAASIWTVMSFAVTANNIYTVGLDGSKFQLIGVNFHNTSASAVNGLKSNAQIVSSEYYSVTGAKLIEPIKGSLNIVKHKMSDGSTVSAKVYIQK